jgi:hypothetical protein
VLRLDATIAFPPRDTFQFSVPATTAWCKHGRSLLIEALTPEGSGVLMRLRYAGDSLTSDSFPIVMPRDTSAAIGAVVALHFLQHDTPRSYTLDSGRVEVRRSGDAISVKSTGTGVESAIRIRVQIVSRDIPIGPDSVSCNYTP